MMLLRSAGVFLERKAERTHAGLLFQEPPRTARGSYLSGSMWIPDSSPGYATSHSKRGLSRPLPRRRALCTN